jgi:hypothetical protein
LQYKTDQQPVERSKEQIAEESKNLTSETFAPDEYDEDEFVWKE